jgi:hypothetical protein
MSLMSEQGSAFAFPNCLLAELTGDPAWQPTFSFGMGYAVRPGLESPRRSVRDVLL